MDNTEAEAKQPKGDQQQGDEEEGPPPGWQSIPPQASAPQQPLHLSSEMAQMVCGSCRQLLSYPRGTLLAKCSCCETVNFVLEAHQVGVVKCDSCTVLLMYPYGAPSVKCSSCHFVTEIGEHNRRPPWSVQQGQPTPPNVVH
ncbi:protein LOL2 isoform X1 [Durio zibethinus]|uniref:Protein LOL2 isoform X1 n=1 Tax=Durio zibethinus TaxID=66656 RepID=A0A6P6BJR9_DURZI|nr:protein LOL2 isoform X1 [Durio zibethinus]